MSAGRAARARAGEAGSPTRRPEAPALRIMGIDPGLASVGYGLLESRAGRLVHLDHGCLVTDRGSPIEERLLLIHVRIAELIALWKPSFAGMESLYFWKNVSSAMPVAEAKGVIRLAFAQAGLSLVEYSPTAIKQAVSGSARSDKDQVQQMVRIILGLAECPEPDHAADALAAAICRANHDGPLTGL